MNRKIGKFKLWQLLLIGGGVGGAIYFYSKNHAPKEAVGLAAATRPESTFPGAGGAEGGTGSQIAPPIPGPPGEPGPPGVAGTPGLTPVAEVSPSEIATINQRIDKLNNALTKSAKRPSAVGKRKAPSKAKPKGAKTNRKTSNAKHQARQHARTHSHPANPLHTTSASAVAVHQHSRPVPVRYRLHPKRRSA